MVAQTTGWKTIGTIASSNLEGNRAWSGFINFSWFVPIIAAAYISELSVFTNFNHSVPTNATIIGVECKYKRYATPPTGGGTTDTFTTTHILFYNSTYLGTDQSTADQWSESVPSGEVITFGAADDLLGASLTPTIVNSASFGFAIACNTTYSSGSRANQATIPQPNAPNVEQRVWYDIAPANPTNLQITITQTKITLTWTDNASDEDNYEVQKRINGGSWTTIQISENSETYIDTTLIIDALHEYRVRATKTTDVNSTYTSIVSGTPRTPGNQPIIN